VLQLILDDTVVPQASRALRVLHGGMFNDLRRIMLDEIVDLIELIVEQGPALGSLLARGPEIIALLEVLMRVRAATACMCACACV